MDNSAILSFSTEGLERDRVEAHPAPTLELIYAFHRLSRAADDDGGEGSEGRRIEDRFLELRDEHPGLVRDIRAVSGAEAAQRHDVALFVLALEFGFGAHVDPEGYLSELPELPGRFLQRSTRDEEGTAVAPERRKKVAASMERLTDVGTAEELRNVLRRLWTTLEPEWRDVGRQAATDAARRFADAYASKGDVLAALPPHHFAQFETSAEKIRAAQTRDHIEVIPLYFASQGGFLFNVHDAYFIGYGIQVEQAHADTEARVREIAARMKAYADPTRLMLLALLAKYGRFTPTVGDLAAQLNVSQPTVSGHLRLLRDAGLVRLEKDGTKSFYHLQTNVAVEPLEELAALLAQDRTS